MEQRKKSSRVGNSIWSLNAACWRFLIWPSNPKEIRFAVNLVYSPSHNPGGSLGRHSCCADQLSTSLSVFCSSHWFTEFQVSPLCDVNFTSFLLLLSSPATWHGTSEDGLGKAKWSQVESRSPRGSDDSADLLPNSLICDMLGCTRCP